MFPDSSLISLQDKKGNSSPLITKTRTYSEVLRDTSFKAAK